jgi:hypothetical protein
MRVIPVFLLIAFGFSWLVAWQIQASGGLGAQGPLASVPWRDCLRLAV